MVPTALSIAEIVAEARAFEIPHVIHRDDVIGNLPDPKPFNLVHIITGIRRCGKTFYAFQWIRRLIGAGHAHERHFRRVLAAGSLGANERLLSLSG